MTFFPFTWQVGTTVHISAVLSSRVATCLGQLSRDAMHLEGVRQESHDSDGGQFISSLRNTFFFH